MNNALPLVDIGANLAHDSFDDDREAVLQRAASVGVKQIIITGSSDDSNVRAAELAAKSPGALFATAGVHPHHASDYTEQSDAMIRTLIREPQVVAVGECGLDYFRNFSPRDDQRRVMQQHIAIARDSQMPLFLHQRDAHEDFIELLEPQLDTILRAVVHCFTDSEAALRDYVDLDLYVGITGWICDERRGRHLYQIVPLIPDDRLLIETDAPYLLPRSIQPKPKSRRNEPAYLTEVVRTVAAARGQSIEHVATITRRNALRFFALEEFSDFGV